MTLDFPNNPSTESTYEYNGQLYVWDGEKWTQGGDVSGDLDVSGELHVAGNTGIGTSFPTEKLDVRGNVYIGSNLQADGYAIVQGPVISKASPDSVAFAEVSQEGSIIAKRQNTSGSDYVWRGGDGNGYTSEIQSDGSIVAGPTGVGPDAYFRYLPGNGITVNQPNTSENIWSGYDGASFTWTSTITAAGNATFESSIETGLNNGDSTITVHQDNALFGAFIVNNNGNQTAKITGAGKITATTFDLESLTELP